MGDVSLLEACRTCGNLYDSSEEMGFAHIFTPQESLETEMAFVRSQLQNWQVHVQPDDGLPQRICIHCFTLFCHILNFRQECLNAQERLLQVIMQAQCAENGLYIETQNNDELQTIIGEQLMNMENGNMVLNTTDLENTNLLQTNGLNVEMNFIENIENLMQTEEVEQTQQNEQQQPQQTQTDTDKSVNIINNNDVYNQNLNNNCTTEIMNNNADAITVCTTTAPTNMDSMDLEDMLESSIIPKNLPTVQKNASVNNSFESENNHDEKYDNDDADDENDDDEQLPARIRDQPFACQYCYCPETGSIDHLIFADCDTLSKHFFDVHDPDRPYNCPYCTLIFETSTKREQHVRDVHINKNPIEMQEPLNIEMHLNTAIDNAIEKIQCLYCKEEVLGSMDLHELNCGYESNWKCDVCNEVFTQTPLARFRTHQRGHNPNKPLNCSYCDRTFVRPDSLAEHEKSHYANLQSITKHKNEMLAGTYSSEHLLKVNKTAAQSEQPTFCSICSKAFASYAFYQRHQEQYHPKKRNANICPNCGTSFTSNVKLRNHLAKTLDENGQCIHTNKDEPPAKRSRSGRNNNMLSCYYCAKRFSSEELFEKHVATHDPQERPLTCMQCQVRCRNELELKEHVAVAHSTPSILNCKICQKSFNCNKEYQKHMLTHAGFKVKCDEPNCAYVGANDRALSAHKRCKHKFLPCNECNLFYTENDLKQHMSTVHEKNSHEKSDDTSIYFRDDSQEHSNQANGLDAIINGDFGNSATNYFELPHMPTIAVNIQPNMPIINGNDEDKNEHDLNLPQFPGLLSANESGDQFYFDIDPDNEIIIT